MKLTQLGSEVSLETIGTMGKSFLGQQGALLQLASNPCSPVYVLVLTSEAKLFVQQDSVFLFTLMTLKEKNP